MRPVARFQFWNQLFTTEDRLSVLSDCYEQFKQANRGNHDYLDERKKDINGM